VTGESPATYQATSSDAALLCTLAAALFPAFKKYVNEYKEQVALVRQLFPDDRPVVMAGYFPESNSANSFGSVLLQLIPELIDFRQVVDDGRYLGRSVERAYEEFANGLISVTRGCEVPSTTSSKVTRRLARIA